MKRVPRPISFDDAVRLLRPQDDPKLLALLDHTLSLGIAGSAVVLGETSLALFDAKNDLIRMLRSAWQTLPGMYRKASRRRRADLIEAAHAVLVVSAFFDTVADSPIGPVRLSEAELKTLLKDETAATATKDLLNWFLAYPFEVPARDLPYRKLTADLTGYYRMLVDWLLLHLRNLSVWDRLSENDRIMMEDRDTLAVAAVRRFHQYRARLSAQVPEFGFWTNLWQQLGAEEELTGLIEREVVARLDEIAQALAEGTGLSGLRAAIGAAEAERLDARWAELGQMYRAQFERPLIDQRDQAIPEGIGLPSLRDAYVNPCFRSVDFQSGMLPSEAKWWKDHTEVRTDLLSYLVTYLTRPAAGDVPLLLLGDPGAGKSVFTVALAATIGDLGYRAVRVDLRNVSANARITQQIHDALFDALKQPVAWADLAGQAGGGIPVVIFDGFDELLQTSGTNQSDYLEEVWQFQREEAALGRPTLAIVTSRTLVAHRARIPAGTAVVRLEPFGDKEISTWLETWNRANEEFRSGRGLEPLSPETVSRYPDLTRQPLLLLMLALYDAADNALKGEQGELADVELYERLLQEFTRRQVRKTHPKASRAKVDEMVAAELDGLSVAALAMFSRGQLHISQSDLDDDLHGLLRPPQEAAPTSGFDDRLTAAELLVDRFFFIHESRKRHGTDINTTLHMYEFMHSTFGEYLVARIVFHALRDLLSAAPTRPRRLASIGRSEVDEVNDKVLAALLSYEILSAREYILPFITLRLHQLEPDARTRLGEILAGVLVRHAHRHDPARLAGYDPRPLDGLARIATYTANLTLLMVMLTDELPLGELLGEEDPLPRWRRLAGVWQAGLDPAQWSGLLRIVRLRREDTGWVLIWGRDPAQQFADPHITDVYLAAALVPSPPAQRLLGAVRSIAQGADDLLGTDGRPVSVLLDITLFDDSEPVGLYDEALIAAQQLPEHTQGFYLVRILELIDGHRDFIPAARAARFLLGAIKLAGRSAYGPDVCASALAHAWSFHDSSQDSRGEWEEVIQQAAAGLLDPRELRPRERIHQLLTVAEFELAGEPLPDLPSFADSLDLIPRNFLDEVTLPRFVRLLCALRPQEWINEQGAAFLDGLPDRLRALVTPEQEQILKRRPRRPRR